MIKVIKRILPSWKAVVAAAAGCMVISGVLFAAFILYLAKDLPSLEQIDNRQVSQSTKIFDRTGKVLLYELSAGQKRTIIPLEEIPLPLKNATVAVEDEGFYTEPAFNWRAILRAALVNLRLREGYVGQGGSTITQQLARNAFLSPEKTITRKLRELILAVNLNRHYTKDQILWLYLNEIPYGSTMYGVEAAANAYFGKSARDLTLAESALLAALPQAPSYYSPWGSHVSELIARQQFILKKMRSLGMVTDEQLRGALTEKLAFAPQGRGIKAPHFVLMVQDYLDRKYGEDVVRKAGLTVVTTLDAELQEIAERVVREGAERNEKLYGGKNAALVAQDPRTGQILALVGSRDYFDIAREGNFNAAVQGLRQPGSALKPFVYLTLFTKGFLPETVLFDVPTEFVSNNPACPPIPNYDTDEPRCFHPENFDEEFRGPITLRNALAQSVNIPSVKVLYLAGMPNVLETLANFGITTLHDPSRFGLSLVLGGGEVRLSELVGAYGVIAADGIRHEQAIVLEVKDASGKVFESYTDRANTVIDPIYPRTVTHILTDAEARSGLFGSSMNLTVFPGHDVALKTGTSNDYRDAWSIGYTPSLVAGVWAGNNDNTEMHKQGSSILAAVPIWSAFMREALAEAEPELFPRPDGLPVARPFFAGEFMPSSQIHTLLYWVDRTNPAGPAPEDPTQDPQFNNWETGVLTWATEHAATLVTNPLFPGFASGTAPFVAIESPKTGGFFSGSVDLRAHLVSAEPLVSAEVAWNGVVVRTDSLLNQTAHTLTMSFTPGESDAQNLLEVRARTASGLLGVQQIVLYRQL